MNNPSESHKVRGEGYYRFFPGDHLRDTMHLSLIEDGVYRRLLDFYYAEERLSSDPERLYRICRASSPDERTAVDYIVSSFFQRDGDRLLNRRAEREIIARRAFLEEQSRKGRLSGEARRAKKEPRANRKGTGVQPGFNPGSTGGRTGGGTEGEPNVNRASASALNPESTAGGVAVRPPLPPDSSDSAKSDAVERECSPDLPEPKPSPPNSTNDLEGDSTASSRKRIGGNGSGQEGATFLAELPTEMREAVEHAAAMAVSGEWRPLHWRRHLLNEGFKDSRKKRSDFRRAMRFIESQTEATP